jgi:hypothetical protein
MPPEVRDGYLRELLNWIDRDLRARECERPSDFCFTKPAKRLYGLVERLAERADCFVGYGPAGIGKTKAAQAIAAENAGAVYVLATWESRSPSGLLKAIHAAVSRRRPKSSHVTMTEVVEKLRRPSRARTHTVLLVDQAHVLHDAAVEMLMHVHELAQCSILFVGTRALRDRLGDDDDPAFGQISSRIGLRVDLAPELSKAGGGGRRALGAKLFTTDEIRRVFRSDKIRLPPDAARALCDLANESTGHLRRVARTFEWAASIARDARRSEILLADVEEAVRWVTDEEVEIVPAGEAARPAAEATA